MASKQKVVLASFLYEMYDDIGELLTSDIIPTQDEIAEFNGKISHLVEHLKKCSKLGIGEVVRGGVLARGTALKGNIHTDLVLFIERFKTFDDFFKRLPAVMDDVHKELRALDDRADGSLVIETRFDTGFTLKLRNPESGKWNVVNLYPAFDIIRIEGKTKVLKKRERASHAPSLVAMVTDVSLSYTDALRDLIRLVLYWRHNCFKPPKDSTKLRFPDALLLELVALDSWQQAGQPAAFDLKKGFKAVLTCLQNYRALSIQGSVHFKINYLAKAKLPVVVHPANPWCNMCDDVNTWDHVAEVAMATMGKPFLQGVEVDKGSDWSPES